MKERLQITVSQKYLIIIMIALGLIVSGLLLPGKILAQNGGEDLQFGGSQYGGIDLVFLVDQSSSMRRNDPYQMRANIIKWVMSDLGIDNLYSRKDAINRIGIVSFGSDARIDLALHSLKTASSEELEKLLKESMFPQVKADDLGNTDFMRGFEKVKEVFDEALPLNNDAPRTRAVILITDGPPYRSLWNEPGGWRENDPELASAVGLNTSYDAYFKVMDDYLKENFPLATKDRSTNGYHIWVVGLNNEAERGENGDPSASWGRISLRWEDIVNSAGDIDRVVQVPTENQSEVPPIIIGILDKTMVGGVCDQRLNITPQNANASGQLACLIGEDFIIPPYISQAVFSVFKPTTSSTVKFVQPNKEALDMTSASVKKGQAGELIEELSVENPEPGEWHWQKVDSSPETITVHLRPIFNEIVLDEALKSIDLFDTVSLRFFLINSGGEAVSELSDYPIEATANVVFPDGTQQRFKLHSGGKGAFIADQQINFDQPGAYKIYVTGSTTNVDGKPLQLFKDVLLQMKVGTLEPSLAQPKDIASLYHEIPVAIELQKPDGSDPDAVSPDAIQITGNLILPDRTSVPMALAWDASSGSFMTTSPYIPTLPGNYNVSVEGSMRLGDDRLVELFAEQQLAFTVDELCPTLASPSDDIPRDKPTKLQIQLDNCTGGPYEEDTSVPWTIIATFTKPDGTTFDLPLAKRGGGLYEAQFTPDADGDWKISIDSTVSMPDGSSLHALDLLQYQINVYPTTLIQLAIHKPQADESLKIHPLPKLFLISESIIGKPSTTRVEIQVQDVNGSPVVARKIADDPTQAVSVEIDGPGQAAGGTDIPLMISPDDPTKLIADVEGLNTKGDYILTASFGATHREYTPASDAPVQTGFKRIDPLAIVTPISMVIELIILLTILFLIFRAVKVRKNPVQGMIEFTDAYGKDLGSLYLTPYRKNIFTINQKTINTNLDPTVSSVIKTLKIKNASTGESSSAISGGDDYGGFSDSDASILVWGADVNGEEFASGADFPAGVQTLLTEGIYATYRTE